MDFTLQHILAELKRIEVLFQRCIERQRRARGSASGLVITDEEIARFFAQEQDEDEAQPAEVAETLRSRHQQAVSQIQAVIAQAQEGTSRFAALCESFELTLFERDALLICLAPIFEPRFERLLGYLHDDVTVRRPMVRTILDLLLDSAEERLQFMPAFLERSPLLQNRLLRRVHEQGTQPSLSGQQLAVDESVVAWLLGYYQPDPRLGDAVQLVAPQIGERDHLLTAEVWEGISEAINGQTVALFHGSDRGVQEATARLLAANAEAPLLSIDLAATVRADLTPLEVVRLVLRDARMIGAVTFVRGWDTNADSTTTPSVELVRALFETTTPVIVSSEAEWYTHGVDREETILRIHFPKPSYRQRMALWTYFVSSIDHETAEDLDLQTLASQFILESRQIQDAVASARDMALQRGEPIAQRDLITAARVHSSPNLSGLARKIEPRYEWTDIVLPADQKTMLRELIDTVRGRGIVMEEWGVGEKLKTSSGVTVLFAGPPGTGKTMSAEVIARELGLDLYKIDLSMVVSKYIGETEKNLGKIFDEAQSSSAVLFFDEADAIFGKRSEVKDSHDRYANMEVSYLLQRMEMYDGVTILATNLRANMDEAFTRRMQFIVDFPFPDEEERLRIWRTLFPPSLPQSSNIDLELLATRFKLAGGNIRNIIAGAAFLAAANGGFVTMEHLLHSTRRELQKMGRLITDVDLTY